MTTRNKPREVHEERVQRSSKCQEDLEISSKRTAKRREGGNTAPAGDAGAAAAARQSVVVATPVPQLNIKFIITHSIF